MTKKPILVSMGDPNGVGPRIVARTLSRPAFRNAALVAVGSRDLLDRALREEDSPLESIAWTPGTALVPGRVAVWTPDTLPVAEFRPGEIRADAGAQSLACVDAACDLCLAGTARAMVTAPLAKEAVAHGCPGFSGHTGHIARRCGVDAHCLALVHGRMWAAFVTTHVALREVADLATAPAIAATGRLLHLALVRFGVPHPRIGVAGLNPHAGEHGLFGNEEKTQVEPAISVLRAEGIDATGPWPADVVFPMLRAAKLDGVVSLYHDQGHPVMKTLAFDLARNRLRGVNLTLGLPIVRTSPDHGTGFDIAWRAPADDGSLVDAIRLADRISRRK